jgi:hypothetical protein
VCVRSDRYRPIRTRIIPCPLSSATRTEDPCQLPSLREFLGEHNRMRLVIGLEKADPVPSGYRLTLSMWK